MLCAKFVCLKLLCECPTNIFGEFSWRDVASDILFHCPCCGIVVNEYPAIVIITVYVYDTLLVSSYSRGILKIKIILRYIYKYQLDLLKEIDLCSSKSDVPIALGQKLWFEIYTLSSVG